MTIKKKLITLLMLIGLVPTLVVSILAYETINKELSSKTQSQLSSIAVKQQQKINSLLQRKQEDVIKLANMYDFQVSLRQYLATNQPNAHDDFVKILRTEKAEVQDINSIDVTSLNSAIVASTTSSAEGNRSNDQALLDQSGQDTVVALRTDSSDGVNKLYITTKLIADKKELAILTVSFRIEDITAAVQDYTGLGSTGETVVGARNNNTVVSLFPLRFDSGAALKTPLTMLGSFNNDDENLAAKDYRGQQAIGVAKSIGFADWILATKMDQKEAFAPVAQLRNTLLSIVVGISLCIIIIALYFTRSFTRPILSLARVSRLIGKGDLSARINFQRQDELGALGQSINAMGLNLKEFVTHIEAERNRLEVILNSTTEGILAIDKNGTIIIANQAAAELTQLSIDMIVGKDIHQTFRWIHSSRPYDINYGTPGNNAYNDLQYVSPAGSIHYVKLIVAQVSSEQEQKAAQTIVTIHDETKSRELENMKIDFVSMAAHELRTPLAATRGYLELISYKGGEHISPDIAKYLHQALKSTSELGGLINNLLDVTRIERGTLTFHPTRLDLAADLAQAVQDARFSAADKHIMLSYNGAANGSFVIADQIAIHEVINNLISNAIKYTPDGGHIEVSLNQNQSQYIVDVKDTGIGIPKAAMANLFTKFYRVHGGLNSGSTGTGLGLFIAKSIIERHGGTITVESQEGIGSVFTFMLPISNGTDSVTGLSQSPTPTYDEATLRRHRGWTTKNITR